MLLFWPASPKAAACTAVHAPRGAAADRKSATAARSSYSSRQVGRQAGHARQASQARSQARL